VSDAFILKTQVRETADVKESISRLCKHLSKLGYYVKATFTETPNMANEFRINKMTETSSNADSFIGYVTDILVTTNKYRTELEEEGLKAELIIEIESELENLQIQRREQKEAIKSRPYLTFERITKMNNLWKHLVDMESASEHIFDDQPELKSLFDLPKSRSHSVESDPGEEVVVAE